MIQSDALSTCPDHVPEIDNNNDDITMLPKDLFINLIDLDLQERIANSDNLNKYTTDALKLLLETGLTSVKKELDDWSMETINGKNILFFRGKNYIPQNKELRHDIA